MLVVSGSTDRSVKLWDAAGGECLATKRFAGYETEHDAGPIMCCAALEAGEGGGGRASMHTTRTRCISRLDSLCLNPLSPPHVLDCIK